MHGDHARDSQPPAHGGPDGHDSVSRLLVAFGRSWRKGQIDLESLVTALEHRGHGVLLVLFGLPNLIPNPIPGLSALFGIPLAILSVQMILQQPHPWLPRWLARHKVERDAYRRIVGRAAPWLAKVERILRPRLPLMLTPLAISLIATLCLMLSLLLALPIPLTGSLLSAPIVLFGLALIQRDGVSALIAALLGNAAMIFALSAGWAAIKTVAAAILGWTGA
jgi:hypothetical protein